VDSIELAEELERHAAKRPLAQGSRLKAEGAGLEPRASSLEPIEVFIQVNVSGEPTKSGCREDELPALARRVVQCAQLRLTGLMTIPPYSEDPEEARPYFRRLRTLRDDLHSSLVTRHSPLKLSMGMSHDFEVAIEEGADVIRVGTALFGARDMGHGTSRA
jgi:pyridoxal phosphate enzyme (YggS family)